MTRNKTKSIYVCNIHMKTSHVKNYMFSLKLNKKYILVDLINFDI